MTPALALILALGLGASAHPPQQQRPRRCLDRRDRLNRLGCGDGTVFTFAPASGVGLPVVAELCGQAQQYMTGNYWCLRGDGTSLAGSPAISPNGSPVQQSLATCPNGPDCTAVNVELTPTTADYFTTVPTVTSPAADFTVCWLGRMVITGAGAFGDLIGRDTGGTGRAFYLEYATNTGLIDFTTFKSGASFTATNSGGPIVSGVRHLVCGTYDFITDGTSVQKVYLDGTQVDTSSVAAGPIQANTQSTGISSRTAAGSNQCVGCILEGAFLTEQALAASDVAALADAVLARTPKSTQGHVLTIARASTKFCAKSDSTAGTVLPNNRICIRNSGAEVEGASTNLAIRSAAFDNAAWTRTNVTAPTADTALAPDGTRTAESLTSTVAGGMVESTAAAITGANGTVSVYVRTAAGTQAVAIRLRDTTAGADRCTGTLTATTTYQRLSCSSVAITTTNNHTVRIYPGDTGGTGTAVFWGAQMEADPVASSYIATAGTSVGRVIDPEINVSPVPPGISPTEGCTKMTFVPGWAGTPVNTLLLGNFSSSSNFRAPYVQSTIADLRGYDGTHIPQTATTYTIGVANTVRTTWSASANLFRINSTVGGVANSTAFTSMGAYDLFKIGTISGAGNVPMVYRDITVGSNSAVCGSTP